MSAVPQAQAGSSPSQTVGTKALVDRVDEDGDEFGSFVEASPVFADSDPLSHNPLSDSPVIGLLDASKPSNLIDEIKEYERNPSSLFSGDIFQTVTPSPATPATEKLRVPAPGFEALGTLPAAQEILTVEAGSGLTPAPLRKPVEPTANGGEPAIERNLGLIDDDYFSSREPAEAIPIVSTPASGTATPRPGAQPAWTLKSMLTPGEATATHHHRHHHRRPSSPTLPQLAPPVVTQGVSHDLLDLDDHPPTPHPFDLPTPVSVRATEYEHKPKAVEGYGSLSSLPSWFGSLLGGTTGEPEDSSQDRRAPYVASPSPVSSPEPQLPSSLAKHVSTIGPHAQGQRGRPLPRARPSLESIQQLYATKALGRPRSRSRKSRSPAARRGPQHEPVNITHATPFAPSSPVLSTSYGTPLNVGFSPLTKTNTIPATSGTTSASPFGTHTFSQIPGAPGFKPEEYDWDKGFSEELERELIDNDLVPRAKQDRNKEMEDGSALGSLSSIFGFGTFKRRGSSERVNPHPSLSPGFSKPYAAHSRTATEPPRLASGSRVYSGSNLAVSTGGRPRSASRGSIAPPTVSQLIEKKVGSVVLKGRKETTEKVLNEELADLIRPHLPPLSRLPKAWTLLYSLDQHGISLNTLYSNCEAPERNRKTGQSYVGMGGVILILRDSETSAQSVDGTFGAFVAEGLGRKSKGFFGGGDSFLWKYSNGNLQVFKATGRNTYFAICENGYMAFGGGSTSYGLYIDSGLLEGYSAPSLTFGNETLCISTSGTPSSVARPGADASFSQQSNLSREVEFECVGLEVWGIGPT